MCAFFHCRKFKILKGVKMGSFIDDFMGSLGGEVSKQLSSTLNLDQNQVEKMIPAVAPLILGGLKKQKDEQGGSDRVDHILNKYGSASVLDNLGDLFSSKASDKNPDPNLGGLLAGSGNQAANLLSQQFNLDGGTANQLIPMLAPVILGFLTKKRDQDGMGSSGISALLDQDGDGSVLDDVAGFLLQGIAGGSTKKQSGGLLGSLLGGLLGGKKR
jgi:hypothetical protein